MTMPMASIKNGTLVCEMQKTSYNQLGKNEGAMNNLPDRILKIEVLDIAASAEQIIHYDTPERKECGRSSKVSTLNVNSVLLSEKSPFFCKLFCNGMRESNQKCVSLQIDASEESAFMDLLNFMESNTLTATSVSDLLDVLKAADRFEVPSCIEYCSSSLFDMPMTLESSLQYLELPLSVQFGADIHPLLDSAKGFIVASYKDIRKYKDKIFCLPLAGIEAILSSDELQVSSEDALYDIVMEWAKIHYPTLEERREILILTLGRYIRFPYMSFRRLMKILSSNDFDHEFASRVVLEALIFKSEAPCHQRILAEKESISTSRRFVERAYKYRPIKVVEFDHPYQQCLVYLDLKRQECKTMYPSRRIYSQAFQLGGQLFFLSASCNFDEKSTSHSFGLFLGMKEKNSNNFPIKYEFSARSKFSEEFISIHKGDYTFTGGKAVGNHNLFGIPWDSFMDENGLYFIDGMLHLKVELTIIRRPNFTLSL